MKLYYIAIHRIHRVPHATFLDVNSNTIHRWCEIELREQLDRWRDDYNESELQLGMDHLQDIIKGDKP